MEARYYSKGNSILRKVGSNKFLSFRPKVDTELESRRAEYVVWAGPFQLVTVCIQCERRPNGAHANRRMEQVQIIGGEQRLRVKGMEKGGQENIIIETNERAGVTLKIPNAFLKMKRANEHLSGKNSSDEQNVGNTSGRTSLSLSLSLASIQ